MHSSRSAPTARLAADDIWSASAGTPLAEVTALYDRAIVIDGLATPNTFNVYHPPAGPRFTPEQLANAQKSGITAVNLTVHGADIAGKLQRISDVKADIAEHPDRLILIETAADLSRAKAEGRLGIIFGFQGLEFMEAELGAIDLFADESVRVMQLTYSGESRIGAGCLVTRDDAGLAPAGHEAVERINAQAIVLDVSHAHPRMARDAIAASCEPVIVSHSGCRAIYDHPRNLPDEVLRAVAESGGVFGIYTMPYLGPDPDFTSRAMVSRHLLHALDICGEDHVGIGTDNSITPLVFDASYKAELRRMVSGRDALGISAPLDGQGPFTVPGLNTPRRIEIIAWDLFAAGVPERVIEKVIGGNFHRVFAEVWGA